MGLIREGGLFQSLTFSSKVGFKSRHILQHQLNLKITKRLLGKRNSLVNDDLFSIAMKVVFLFRSKEVMLRGSLEIRCYHALILPSNMAFGGGG